jgi:kynureninase
MSDADPLGPGAAEALDTEDPFGRFRAEFHVPLRPDGTEEIYLCGNSLGLHPRRTAAYLAEELDAWRELAVKGHFDAPHPWMPYHELLAAPMGRIVGATPSEVVVMNALTVNLHLMMVSFYRPTASRHKVLIERHAFPSDHYAVESQIRFHGHDPRESLVLAEPREGEECLRHEDLAECIEREGESLALVLLPGVQYYTGQLFPIGEITRLAAEKGAYVGWDLAHAAGNVPLALHDDDVDFAVWCTYKYLNSGPGSVGGCFVHERHARDATLPRFAGWWGHDKETRFRMGPDFVPIPGAEGWQLSNPPILSLAAIRASLDVFEEAGGVGALREKSVRLTAHLEAAIEAEAGEAVEIITPREPERRGCQLSLRVRGEGRAVFERLGAAGVTCDWREPDVIRVAPVPLYNTFGEVERFARLLGSLL